VLTLDNTKNDTSTTLDLLRAVAAQMVCVGHGISFFIPALRPDRLPLMQNVGVLIFFVLSGFLIAYVLIERSKSPEYNFWQFLIGRFARIYSALLPALIVVAVIDGFVIYRTGAPTIARYYDWPTLLANLLMLENYRGVFLQSSAHWSSFGSDSPLWTLAIEWHIYLFVGTIFFMGARPRSIPYLIPIAFLFGQSPAHYLLGSLQEDGVGRGLFLLWIGGSYLFLISQRIRLSKTFSIFLFAVAGVAYLCFTKTGHEYNFLTYPALLIVIFGLIQFTQHTTVFSRSKLERVIRFVAGYSFTLYLVHYTIMMAVVNLWPGSGVYRFLSAVVAANVVACAIAVPTEMRHRKFAQYLKSYLAKGLSFCRPEPGSQQNREQLREVVKG
jgi:peptidoglycan/LPS O-acetylase OafA/YrhL